MIPNLPKFPPVPIYGICTKLIRPGRFIRLPLALSFSSYCRQFNRHLILFFSWSAWKTNIKFSFLKGTKFHQNTASNGNHPALPYQHSSQQTVPLPDNVMRAAAHHCSLPSSFTRPILIYNQGLGDTNQILPISLLPSDLWYCYYVQEVAWGQRGASLQSLVVFLFTFFFSWLISSTRLGRLAGEKLKHQHWQCGSLSGAQYHFGYVNTPHCHWCSRKIWTLCSSSLSGPSSPFNTFTNACTNTWINTVNTCIYIVVIRIIRSEDPSTFHCPVLPSHHTVIIMWSFHYEILEKYRTLFHYNLSIRWWWKAVLLWPQCKYFFFLFFWQN